MDKYIQKLILLDNQLNILQHKISLIKNEKKNIEQIIIPQMVQSNKTKIVHLDKQIVLNKTKIYNVFSIKYLEKSLNQLIEDDDIVTYIIRYLKENREIKIMNEIKIYDYNNE